MYDDAISPAGSETGFEAIRIDRVHPGIAQTINDAIIAEIKKSKFLISDYTGQRGGVYFEAGYALGKDRKVIYTCPEIDKDHLHFDVNHFPIIFYKDATDLKTKLKMKIEAYILD